MLKLFLFKRILLWALDRGAFLKWNTKVKSFNTNLTTLI